MLPISPSIGRWQPRPRDLPARHLIQLPPELFATVKLLAYVREENLGNAVGRCIRHALDELATDPPIEYWPLDQQVILLVPEKLRSRVKPDGRVPSPYTYRDRPEGMCLVSVPLSEEERVTARIAAFGSLTSLACWGAEAVQSELRKLSPDAELWTLPHPEQVRIFLPTEPAAWGTALTVMNSSWRATRYVPDLRGPEPGEEFRLLDKVG